MKKDRKIIFVGAAVVILMFFGVVISANLASSVRETTTPQRRETTVVDPETGQTIIISKDGLVTIIDADGTKRTEIWDSDKINSFLDYMNSIYGQSENYSIVFASDELIETITEDTGGPSDGSSGDEEDISQYFATPTPPSGNGGGGNGDVVDNDSDGDGIADDDVAPSWCKFWRLSYCADPIAKASPTPQSSYPPGVIIANDCDDWNEQSDYKSVISNSSCAKFSPTPSPQPQ